MLAAYTLGNKFLGDPNVTNGLQFISANWNNDANPGSVGGGWPGDFYAMYGVKKGLQLAGISTVDASTCGNFDSNPYGYSYGGTGADWQADYNNWLVSNQINYGTEGSTWTDNGYTNQISTATPALAAPRGMVPPPQVTAH